MILQATDRCERSIDILRELLADGFEHFFKIIEISERILGILFQPGEDLPELFITSSDRVRCISPLASAIGLFPIDRLDDDGA
jgi:hypothetical protein